jgi:hypothetical protein
MFQARAYSGCLCGIAQQIIRRKRLFNPYTSKLEMIDENMAACLRHYRDVNLKSHKIAKVIYQDFQCPIWDVNYVPRHDNISVLALSQLSR